MYKHTLTVLRTLQHLPLPPTYNKFRGCKHPTCHEFRGCRHFQVCPQHTLITTKRSHAPCSCSHQFRGCTATSRQPSCQPTQPNKNALRNDRQQSYAMPPHQLAHPLKHEPRAQVATAAARVVPPAMSTRSRVRQSSAPPPSFRPGFAAAVMRQQLLQCGTV